MAITDQIGRTPLSPVTVINSIIVGLLGVSLLGDIGGQLGLFVGISFITLIEFLDLLLRLILPRKKTTLNQVTAFDVKEDKESAEK